MNGRLVGVALLLGVATGLVTACTAESGTDTAAAPYRASDAGTGGADSAGQGEKPGAAGEPAVSRPGVDRSLVRTATLDLTTADVARTVDRARDITASEGGFSGREDVREASATLVLRIPSDRFDGALDQLSGLGRVISRVQSAEDVTEQVVDLDSRIASQRASVDRVRALLARAATVEEIVSIEGQLTTREADLESLEQRRQALAGQVAMSTVTVRVSEEAAPPVAQAESSGFLAGLSDGWHAFLGAGAVTLRVLGAMLPFLLVLAIPAAALLRWRRRRTVVQEP
ncbi:DUF4349 domain-containing protein [Actinophytocola oryzae]|uniref:Uncharacterized protein DUF4349 n=1 Tax=Actinophytocola oryzae TaxID=502181 RepID=A0A4R7W4N5_9PSEU|nr:DUF4349 domain-containing protein [Actinophytocola oryzae]TDV57673.1 uncharacterized protein DUF4349 [Actinophytocola oryzae]